SSIIQPPPTSTLFPYTTLFRSSARISGIPGGGESHRPRGTRVNRQPGRQRARRTDISSTIHLREKFLEAIQDQTQYIDAVVSIRSEEHTSELQSLTNLVCRLLL